MKTPIIHKLTRTILLISAMALVAPPLRAARGAAETPSENSTQSAQASDIDGEENDQAQRQEEAKERERERREREQEKIQEKLDRDKERKEQERERADRLYEKGTKALDKRQWEDAAKLFDETVKKGGERVEGAYYWKAYAQHKNGMRDQALATLAELSKGFPKSRWSNDAKELEVEIRQASGQPVSPEGQPDEELKLMALNGLMNADPERALPLIQKLLQSSQPLKIKERALFVLSQKGSAKAKGILAEFARGKTNPDLQLKSLEFLALFGGNDSRQVLAEAYASADDNKIKRSILGFFMAGGDRERLLAAAKEEKDSDLRREAIGQLGALGAQKELSDLYGQETAPDLKKRILEAMFAGGNPEKLLELAQKEKDPGLRLKAVELLGPMGSEKTGAGLSALYDNEKDRDIRKKIIESLFVQGNAKALVAIAKTEKDPQLKKKAIEQLSVMNSKEGTELFEEMLNK